MAYTTRTSDRYEEDLDSALDYITNTLYSPKAALRMLQKTRDIISLIKENPYNFPLYHNKHIAGKGYRYAIIGNYLMFYRISEERKITTIESFIHGQMNIPEALI
jgi:plasmid stabilization system protein ParE